MNYSKHYENLIKRAKYRTLTGYSEKHHVLPKCLKGIDETKNIVELTAREHFIAHLLLFKIYPKQYGLIKAINMMCCESLTHKRNRTQNRMYGWLKQQFSESMRISQLGEKNSNYGKKWIYSIEEQKNKKVFKDEIQIWLNKGWKLGRVMNFTNIQQKEQEKVIKLQKKEKLLEIKKKKELQQLKDKKQKEIKRQKRKEEQFKKEQKKAQLLFKEFKEGAYKSMSSFARKKGINKMTLSKRWRKFIPEYKTEHGKTYTGVGST